MYRESLATLRQHRCRVPRADLELALQQLLALGLRQPLPPLLPLLCSQLTLALPELVLECGLQRKCAHSDDSGQKKGQKNGGAGGNVAMTCSEHCRPARCRGAPAAARLHRTVLAAPRRARQHQQRPGRT